jgi:hypothetical protein
VYFCEVKGVTHNNDDGTSRIAAQQLCSVGDTVKLVPDPSNEHDRNAIRVLLQTGQQIGYISARQAARFRGNVHLLTATVHSRVKDEWGNDTVELRVSPEQKVYEASTAPSITAIQAEATKTVEKEGWQAALVYFENAGQGLYKVVKAKDAEAISESLQEGMAQVGFIGLTDAPKGIQFTFALNDGLPTNGIIAKRFLLNAREWIATQSKDVCARRGDPAPIVGAFQPSRQPTHIKLVLILLAVIGLIVLIIATIGGGEHDTSNVPSAAPDTETETENAQFSAMTPSKHLTEVKRLLTKAQAESNLAAINTDLEQARKHKAAIPKGTPEHVQAARAISQIERLYHANKGEQPK